MEKLYKNIIIKYESEATSFINEIYYYLISKIDSIYSFFNHEPQVNITINIISTKDKLDKIFFDLYNRELREWGVGFTSNHNNDYKIFTLSYNDYNNTSHKGETISEYKKMIVHEFVHIVHLIFCYGNYPISPLWEGVATYLSEQYSEVHDISATKEELMECNCNFSEYYSLFVKIIEKYPHETVLKILRKEIDGEQIIDEILKTKFRNI